jgi:hypothetical protein
VNHTTCDLCGKPLLVDSEVRYELRMEIKAAYDPLVLSDEDLQKDYRTEIAGVLRQLEGLSTVEAQNEVYRVFDFDLCRACQRRLVHNPLPRTLLDS